MKTLQEWFDNGVKGLESQGFMKSKEGKSCAYQSEIGCCALGWTLPPDYRIKADQESKNVNEILKDLGEDIRLLEPLYILRRAHDYSKSPADMKRRFIGFAEEYDLICTLKS
jgi:hypothetical protein